MKRDFYEVLGCERTADADTIKKAYRKMAMQYHPDKNPGDKGAEDKFKEAARAYEVLSSVELRARYDRFGHQGVDGPAGGGRGGGPHFQDVGDIFEAFGDIFGDFFGQGGGRGRTRGGGGTQPARGSDLRYVMEIDLHDVVTGVENPIEFECEEGCKECSGTGAAKGSAPEVCTGCGGRGQVLRQQGFFSMATTCPQCRGQGTMVKNPCPSCRGRGRVGVQRKLLVKVPPGVDNGTQLRMTGEGEAGIRGGPAGDLYVELRVRPDKRFERDGEDLYSPLEVNYLQALLGAEVEVETLRGVKKTQIPKGCQYGQQLQLRGEGLPSLRGARVGDLNLVVKIVMPKKLAKDEEKLLKQIAELKGDGKSGSKFFF